MSDAASLTEAFEKIGTDFTKANPNATVTFNPGSSGTLATQIQQTNGAGIDTFASADEDNMNKLVTANLIDGTPQVFAKNKLIIVTKPGQPEERQDAGRPRQPRHRLALRPDGPVREVRGADPADRRGDDPRDQGHPRHRREGDARRGDDR